MKNPLLSTALALALSLGTIAVSAEKAPEGPDYQLQPLTTRHARTATKITLHTTARFFDGMELQEANNFDGYTVEFELTIPFWERFQLRLYYPAYTDGDARLTQGTPGQSAPGDKVDVSGDGGTFDFPSAILDYQFRQASSPEEWNLAAFAGYGEVITKLKTRPTPGDVYNHQGQVVLLGLTADRELNDRWTGVANLGGRYYLKSDDLNPVSDDDVFGFMDASVAVVYDPPSLGWVYPALELVYQGDLGSYNNFHLDPQLIIPISQNFELKAGAGIGLSGDGEDWQGRLQAVLRY